MEEFVLTQSEKIPSYGTPDIKIGGKSIANPNMTSTRSLSDPTIDDKIEEARTKLIGYLDEMRTFRNLDSQDVFLKLSEFSATASHYRATICKREDRKKAAFRTHDIEPFIAEVERQFKIWSRLVSSQNLDWEMTRG
jgi:hypothetical protein